ncbi:hypothetical protein [Saccharicrinis sp. GN24d3]
MKIVKLNIIIESIQNSYIGCLVSGEDENIRLSYSADDGTMSFLQDNHLSQVLSANKFQFYKVLNSAISGDMEVGQLISCVFIEGFNFLSEDDFSKRYLVIDRRSHKLVITA